MPRIPWQEALAATIAAGAWFLAMPGSPLEVQLHGSDPLVASAVITVAGGLALTLAAPLLRTGAANPGLPGTAVSQLV